MEEILTLFLGIEKVMIETTRGQGGVAKCQSAIAWLPITLSGPHDSTLVVQNGKMILE